MAQSYYRYCRGGNSESHLLHQKLQGLNLLSNGYESPSLIHTPLIYPFICPSIHSSPFSSHVAFENPSITDNFIRGGQSLISACPSSFQSSEGFWPLLWTFYYLRHYPSGQPSSCNSKVITGFNILLLFPSIISHTPRVMQTNKVLSPVFFLLIKIIKYSEYESPARLASQITIKQQLFRNICIFQVLLHGRHARQDWCKSCKDLKGRPSLQKQMNWVKML